MGRNLEFDSRVLELNSRFLPKASLPLLYPAEDRIINEVWTWQSVAERARSLLLRQKWLRKVQNEFKYNVILLLYLNQLLSKHDLHPQLLNVLVQARPVGEVIWPHPIYRQKFECLN